MKQPKKYFFENERILHLFDFIQKVVFILGIPLSILTYYLASEKEKNDREVAEYNKLDDVYLAYESMCVKYPLLGVSDISQSPRGRSRRRALRWRRRSIRSGTPGRSCKRFRSAGTWPPGHWTCPCGWRVVRRGGRTAAGSSA